MTVSAPPTLRSWQGRRIVALVCAVAFLDFIDASITNVALPHILTSLHFSVQSLQWMPSASLLTYGGFMLLGGRLADPYQAHAAEPQADSPLAAAAPEPITKEI